MQLAQETTLPLKHRDSRHAVCSLRGVRLDGHRSYRIAWSSVEPLPGRTRVSRRPNGRCGTRSLVAAGYETAMPSLPRSPCTRGALRSGFARRICRPQSRTFFDTASRPPRPRRDCLPQRSHEPSRDQATTASDVMGTSGFLRPGHGADKQARKKRDTLQAQALSPCCGRPRATGRKLASGGVSMAASGRHQPGEEQGNGDGSHAGHAIRECPNNPTITIMTDFAPCAAGGQPNKPSRLIQS